MYPNSLLTPVLEAETGLFHPAPLATLRPDSGCNFALYLAIPWRGGQRYLLYKAADYDLSEKKRRELIENGVQTLWVREDETGKYFNYVDHTVGQVLRADNISPKEKGHILYETTHSLVKSTFSRPDSPLLISTNQKVVAHTVSVIAADPSMFRSMVSLFAFDYSLYTHSVHVSVLGTGLLVDIGGFPEHTMRETALGFLLHDIGKSRVPPEIVRKPGMLSPWENKQMEKHPEYGVQLMQQHPAVGEHGLQIVNDHHEKLNGAGYPRKLAGDSLSLATRVCSVVDIYDALTSHRVYKPALRGFDALRMMMDRMSGELDMDILQSLVRLLGPNATRTVSAAQPVKIS